MTFPPKHNVKDKKKNNSGSISREKQVGSAEERFFIFLWKENKEVKGSEVPSLWTEVHVRRDAEHGLDSAVKLSEVL